MMPNNPFTVYISCRESERAFAHALGRRIEQERPGEALVTVSAASASCPGRLARLEPVLQEIDWFILLRSGAAEELDWPLFELGNFCSLTGDRGRVICVHEEDSLPPAHISFFRVVPYQPAAVTSLIRSLHALTDNADEPLSRPGCTHLRLVSTQRHDPENRLTR